MPLPSAPPFLLPPHDVVTKHGGKLHGLAVAEGTPLKLVGKRGDGITPTVPLAQTLQHYRLRKTAAQNLLRDIIGVFSPVIPPKL